MSGPHALDHALDHLGWLFPNEWREFAPKGPIMPKTTVTPAEGTNPADPFGDGAYVIDCECGEHVTYSGRAFTQVEAMRHERYHQRKGS